MVIGIAGPYSADTEEQRLKNLEALNKTAAQLLSIGHIPLIGVNAALPVIKQSKTSSPYEDIMKISMAVINCCDAILLIAESPGANRERDLVLSKGLPVYYNINEISPA